MVFVLKSFIWQRSAFGAIVRHLRNTKRSGQFTTPKRERQIQTETPGTMGLGPFWEIRGKDWQKMTRQSCPEEGCSPKPLPRRGEGERGPGLLWLRGGGVDQKRRRLERPLSLITNPCPSSGSRRLIPVVSQTITRTFHATVQLHPAWDPGQGCPFRGKGESG